MSEWERELKRHKDAVRFHENKIESLIDSIHDAERAIVRWNNEIADHAAFADDRRAQIAQMEEEA